MDQLELTHQILLTVSHHELPKFQEMLHEAIEKLEGRNPAVSYSVSCVPVALDPRAGMMLQSIPTALIEYDATKEEWEEWRRAEKFKIVKP